MNRESNAHARTARFRAGLLTVLTAVTLAVAVLATINRFDTLPQGMTAVYYADVNWSSLPVRSVIEAEPSTDTLMDTWQGSPPQSFSATWIGSVVIVRGGVYSFAAVTDGRAWVYVDGHLVVDGAGPHPARSTAAAAALAQGAHEVFIQYVHVGDAPEFELSWARNGGPWEPIPASALSVRHREFSRSLLSFVVRRAVRAASWLWLSTFAIFAGTLMASALGALIAWFREDQSARTLGVILLGSFALNVLGIAWGVPGFWMGDEITPNAVLTGLSQRFSDGWFNRYPPFHFYVLSAVFSPWLVSRSWHWIHASDGTQAAVLLILGRVVSVVAGLGTVIGVSLCGRQAFGRRAGLFAAAMMALLSIFVFYSKSANPEVPYVFWFTVSLLFYTRFIRTLAAADLVWCAAAAAVAIGTKDQAYALYLSVPFAIMYCLWRSNRERRIPHAFGRALLDRRLALAGATAVILLLAIHNVPFNVTGAIRHVRDITGPGSQPYRMVEPTAAGRLALIELTEGLNQESWGWPFWIASLIGLVVALREPQSRRFAICLALVLVSYYVGFIDVILYNYDRYLLPLCVVQALFGGVAFDRLLRWDHAPSRLWRAGLVAGVFAYTLLYAATVDVLMMRDSRYTVERWLHVHVHGDDLVGAAFPAVVRPRLDDFDWVELRTADDLKRWSPGYFVLNADYARAVPADTPTGRMVAGLQSQTLGYRLAFRYRSPAPWRWLPSPHRDLVGPRLEMPVASILRDVNPTIEVYQRIGLP
jgi:PA14 domain/Dolichyl-phosphate-mannose-protein mannosyltransferase